MQLRLNHRISTRAIFQNA